MPKDLFRKLIPSLQNKFDYINRNVTCLHQKGEATAISNVILAAPSGPIVECGCFRGGMTCKLSILCKITNRKLYIYDSFLGLPYGEDCRCYKSQIGKDGYGGIKKWQQGSMASSLNNVKSTVNKFGSLESCVFVPGFFENTLKQVVILPAVVFIDVDLVASARECIKCFWPKLIGNYFFSHEMWFETYVKGITDKNWWSDTMNYSPPFLYGAEFGIHPTANDLGFFWKDPILRL